MLREELSDVGGSPVCSELWGRGGVMPEVLRAGALGFDVEAVLEA